MTVTLKHESGLVKQSPLGFSWTTLFFSFLVPIIRGDWKWALIMILLCSVSCGFAVLVFPFIYNKIYIKELLVAGFTPADDASAAALSAQGIYQA